MFLLHRQNTARFDRRLAYALPRLRLLFSRQPPANPQALDCAMWHSLTSQCSGWGAWLGGVREGEGGNGGEGEADGAGTRTRLGGCEWEFYCKSWQPGHGIHNVDLVT